MTWNPTVSVSFAFSLRIPMKLAEALRWETFVINQARIYSLNNATWNNFYSARGRSAGMINAGAFLTEQR